MSDSRATPRRLRVRDIALAIVMTAWVVAVARAEHAVPLTPPVVSYAAVAR